MSSAAIPALQSRMSEAHSEAATPLFPILRCRIPLFPKRLNQPQKYKKNFSHPNETRNKFGYLGYFYLEALVKSQLSLVPAGRLHKQECTDDYCRKE